MSIAAIAIPFDTLAFVRRLENAGVPSAQAEAQVEMLSDVIQKVESSRMQESATKGDIDLAKMELQKEIREVELKLEAKIETTKAELRKDVETAKVETIKWVIVTGVAILGGVAAMNRLVPPVPAMYHPPAQEMRQQVPAPAPSPPAPSPPAPSH